MGREPNPRISEHVRRTLTGIIGSDARAWKGMDAGYAAKHVWISKHYGSASDCVACGTKDAKRYEWANISGEYKRERSDYMEMCVS